ncbi:MAG: alpha-L-arabinofuranosidase C-terminal domain-containing protein [Planctomycetota bacterium]
MSIIRAVPLALAAATLALAGQPSANLAPNPSFEEGKGNRPEGWGTHVYAGKAAFDWEAAGHSGKRSVAVTSETGADASWQFTAGVHPDSIYRLSGWVKTENVKATTGRGALLNIHTLGGAETQALTGTKDWMAVAVEFETGARTEVTANCLFGGWGQATGKAWFDDIRLELLHRADREHPSALVDLGDEQGPISPYIYGQFIEHLGRCIYGGIWAEMLSDRKFYNLVASRHSPWKRLGGEVGWSLTMDVERPYVGKWSVKVHVTDRAPKEPHGIVQRGLGVVKGKQYVGRVVAAGRGTLGAALIWGPGGEQTHLGTVECDSDVFKAYPIRFRAGATTDDAMLALGLRGTGTVWIGTVSLMPADNVNGMRADTLALLKKLDSPIYRWPGGNFVSGYDWRDGLGPRDQRPPRKNPAWKGIEHNDFGIDEFIAYCRELGTEPLVVVNTGLGSPELAAALVEYCNGSAKSHWGKRRAANGHPEPYDVAWWGVGNEMYGGWQLGHVPIQRYVVRHNEFARAMRAVDPDIQLVAVGASGKWSQQMLTHCAQAMDALSEHFYCRDKKDLEAHVAQIPDAVRGKAVAHRRYWQSIPALEDRRIPIALDEWNYWYGDHRYGELGVRYHLKDALGIARGIHEMVRHRDVFLMANYAQTVNVIGCIKTTKTAAAFATTGLPLALYRKRFGTTAVAVKGRPVPLDVAVALTEDKKRATIAIVNPTRKAKPLELDIRGGMLATTGTRYLIAGQDPMAYNEPGKPPAVRTVEEPVEGFNPAAITVPPLSISVYVLDAARR